MKNILLLIALFVVIPTSMQSNFVESKREATITITNDLLICKSFFEPIHNKPVHYVKPLKVGENSHYFVPFVGMSVKVILIKY